MSPRRTSGRKRVVTIGGGNGQFVVLSGLKHHPVDLTAVVNVSDNGGSSGRLRDEFGHLPPGDLRQCLVALAPDDEQGSLLRGLFDYRFTQGDGLNGHSFGNLFLTALTVLTGSMAQAIEEASRLLGIRGRVLPVSLTDATLVARLSDGSRLVGETLIDHRRPIQGVAVEEVFLDPPAQALPEVLAAIEQAALVVIGPGDLYTSILPNILTRGVAEALQRRRGRCVLVGNLMTKPGETDGFTASRFLSELRRYIGQPVVDYLLVNSQPIPKAVLQRYAQEGAYPVPVDEEALTSQDVRLVCRPLLAEGDLARHDPVSLGSALMETLEDRGGDL
ncbi:MAG: uridine diphosphate-N-acetylglucosamine-binding protein YvcK [Dehalococcoidia bacterium]